MAKLQTTTVIKNHVKKSILKMDNSTNWIFTIHWELIYSEAMKYLIKQAIALNAKKQNIIVMAKLLKFTL